MSTILEKIKSEIEIELNNLDIWIYNKESSNLLEQHITPILQPYIINNDILYFKFLCNDENNPIYNLDNIYNINIEVFIQLKTKFHIDILSFNIIIDKIIALRKIRNKKLKIIYDNK